ncbi:MAG: SUMF1/EgtB/PvdO family nonheme iron enzyme [Myxococcales bacterium]|nr:SUMF1/EgtB/PvdO family nonheme iron enzyme [Myxococcales bacterium]
MDWTKLPVSGVDFSAALAYAEWLSRSGAVPGARLCTEHEWERAARGADDRRFPHGDGLAPGDANFDETYGKEIEALAPDEIGSYPQSRSPFGLYDMAGNVWEWTRSSVEPEGTVIRGGGFFRDRLSARASNRAVFDPGFKSISVGVRICASRSHER